MNDFVTIYIFDISISRKVMAVIPLQLWLCSKYPIKESQRASVQSSNQQKKHHDRHHHAHYSSRSFIIALFIKLNSVIW